MRSRPQQDRSESALPGGVGVVCRLTRPSIAELIEQVRVAEEAGADWMVLPDNLGWHDVWMSLVAASTATSRILLGPAVTNPYTRHPFITIAALATLHEVSEGRAFVGIGAGGSELAMYADIDRSDSPERVRDLIASIRRTMHGDPPLPMTARLPVIPLLGAARKRQMVEAVSQGCDVVLLSGQARDDMLETAKIVLRHGATVAWSPMLTSDGPHLRAGIVYGLLNSPVATRRRLGVDHELEADLKDRLASGGTSQAAELVPDAAVEAFVIGDDIAAAQDFARRLGSSSVAVQAFDTGQLPDRVAWAKTVLDQ